MSSGVSSWRRRDVVGDGAIADLKAALSGGEAPVEDKKFPECGHLAHLDEREEYVTVSNTQERFMNLFARERLKRGAGDG